jgi:hypothetical protein
MEPPEPFAQIFSLKKTYIAIHYTPAFYLFKVMLIATGVVTLVCVSHDTLWKTREMERTTWDSHDSSRMIPRGDSPSANHGVPSCSRNPALSISSF